MNAEAREHLTAHLMVDEGVVLHAYRDSLGYLTIGCGRLIDKQKGGGISHEEALYLLEHDVERHWRELIERMPWVLDLDDVRQVVLANMAFQLGVNGLAKFVNTLAAVKRGDWPAAVSGMKRSLWFMQTQLSRTKRLTDMMLTGEWPERNG